MFTPKELIPIHSVSLLKQLLISSNNKQGLVSIILAGATFEAFLNDLEHYYSLSIDDRPQEKIKKNSFFASSKNTIKISLPISDLERKIMNSLSKLEEDKKSINIKYTSVVRLLSNKEVDLKKLQELRRLSKIRNGIIHPKGVRLNIELNNNNEIPSIKDQYPKFLKPLFDQKILKVPSEATSWINILDTQEFCKWVLDTMDLIFYILSLLPQDEKLTKYFSDNFKIFN